MTELKPCPFCGYKAELLKSHSCDEIPYFVICSNDKCKASLGYFSKTKEKAIESWNRRVNEDVE